MLIAAVVADANVLLSAAVGKAAARIFAEYDIIVHAAEFNLREVEAYLPLMAAKCGLAPELVSLSWRLLPLRVHPLREYRSRMKKAVSDLRSRDPEDAHVLALARALRLPIWSNDRDLALPDVSCYPTAVLLKIAGE